MKRTLTALLFVSLLPLSMAAQPATGAWTSGTYVYDGSGNIVRVGADGYVYDTAGRLVSGTADQQQRGGTNRQEYTYDSFGNRLTSSTNSTRPCANSAPCELSVGVNSANNHMGANAASFDDAGNLRGWDEPHGTANVHHDYAFDAAGMIATQTDGAHVTEFVYTSDDQRIAVYADQAWTWSVRDQSQRVVRDFASTGTQWSIVEDRVFSERGPLGSVSAAGSRHFHLDQLGTPRLVTDNSRRVTEHAYYPFGAEIVVDAASDPERLKFTGHERDTAAAGLQQLDYMHARYYGAGLGRFLAADPEINFDRAVSHPQGWNRYAYVSNNPITKLDPDGRDEFLFVWKPVDGVGHTAVGIQNRDAQGRPDGTVTVRHLWPADTVGKSLKADADYRVETIKETELAKFEGGEQRGAEGILRIKGDAKQDTAVTDALKKSAAANPTYIAPSNTCSTFGAVGVEAAGIKITQTGTVTVQLAGMTLKQQTNVVTPIAVYNSVADSKDPRVQVVKPLPQKDRDPNLTMSLQ